MTVKTFRVPLFVLALVVSSCIVSVQIGSALLPNVFQSLFGLADRVDVDALVDRISQQVGDLVQDFDQEELQQYIDSDTRNEMDELSQRDKPPGLGIAYMALVDGVVLFSLVLVGLSVVIPANIHARFQGCATIIFAILLLLATIVLVVVAIALLILMVVMFLAFPFGTIAYLVLYGSFDRSTALAFLGLLMTLKIILLILIVLSHEMFIQNLGLVLLLVTSLVANVIVTFLISFPPGVFVSITDAVAGIVMGVCGAIWMIILGIGALFSIVSALKPKS